MLVVLAAGAMAGGGPVGTLRGPAVPASRAQDANVHRPAEELEALLATGEFTVPERKVIRPGRRPTELALLDFGQGERLAAKWRRAPDGGHEWNNAPRYELAAYEIQKLFLEPADYVVPPTALRCFRPRRYATLTDREDAPDPTFSGPDCVLVLLQYWLRNVTASGVWDEERMREDEAYARRVADLDLLTFLIEHKDANTGNFLVSTARDAPRVFAVDNGVSFRARRSPRGAEWRWLRVRRISTRAAGRLRAVTREELHRRLGVLVQFEARGDSVRRTPPGENLDPGRGTRVEGGAVQLGLDREEIEGLYRRIRQVVRRLDEGELVTW